MFDPREELTIENPPKIEGVGCKIKLYMLYFMLSIAPILLSLYIGYEYDWLYGAGAWVFLFLLASIVGSKLRLLCVPADQMERNLSFLEISRWYIGKHHCK
jgi:hypothetical protein